MSEPLVSVVLATDVFATGAPCVEALRRQTIAPRLELLLVGPGLEAPEDLAKDLHTLRVLDVEFTALVEARARGILAASAPCVFVAETHAFPEPRCLELLATALDAGAAAAMPRFSNANPESASSWASLFATYGGFTGDTPYEPDAVPLHNGAFRRDVLQRVALENSDDLVYGVGISRILRAEGRRLFYVPEAVVAHLNVAQPQAIVWDRLATSRVWAGQRARTWSTGRRIAYAFGSPLIPFAFLAGVMRSDGWHVHRGELPRWTLSVLAFSTIPIAAGELFGYARGPGDAAERHVRLELHRTDYV